MDAAGVFKGLNEDQREAVSTVRGPLVILAGAGTGKTTTVTRRIAYQVMTQTFDAPQILAVTFSSKAAGELRSRLTNLGVRGVRAMTFHAEALGQYRSFVNEQTRILASKPSLLYRLAKSLPKPYRFTALRDLATEIEWAKNRRISPDRYTDQIGDHPTPIPADVMAGLFASYEKAKGKAGVIDFEDLLGQLCEHLEGNQRDLGLVQGRYRAFTVDEYQDVNLLQESLLRAWVGSRDDLCVVGDDYQSIYGFTGATAGYLLSFSKRYENAAEVRLVHNYRSTPQVLARANKLVDGLQGSRKSLLPTLEPGPEPALKRFAEGKDEVEWIKSEVSRLAAQGVAYKEMAILVRINARTEPFEEAFAAAGIPYQVKEGSFLKRPAAKSFLAQAKRGLATDVGAAVRQITDELGFSDTSDDESGQIADDLPQEEVTRQQDLLRLRQLGDASEASDLRAFAEDLITRFAGDEDGSGVVLMSYHRSKGLEFDAVFLPRLDEGELPIRRAKTPDEIAEERRLFYVGITRAKRYLSITTAASRPEERKGPVRASAFMAEIGASPRGAQSSRGSSKGSEGGASQGGRTKVSEAMMNDPLFGELRGWRLKKAKEQGLPAYIVFPDSTLVEIAKRRPDGRADLRAISGVGPLKLKRYGDEVLDLIKASAS